MGLADCDGHMDIEPLALIERLRKSEINFSISHFYDRGYNFALGDDMNGWLDDWDFETFEAGVTWLWQAAEKHYPEAECFE